MKTQQLDYNRTISKSKKSKYILDFHIEVRHRTVQHFILWHSIPGIHFKLSKEASFDNQAKRLIFYYLNR